MKLMKKMIKNLIPVLFLTVVSLSWSTTPQNFRGQATDVSATVLGITTALGDTGALGAKGGALQSNLLTVSLPAVLSGTIGQADVIGVGDHTEASAMIAAVNLLTSGIGITADAIQSHAYVVGSNGKAPVSTGSSQLLNLQINGSPIIVTGAPNQTISLPLATIVLNEIEQGAGTITVTALHLTIAGIADVKLARSYAAIGPCTGCNNSCSGTPNCSGNYDFLTGEGELLNSLGAKVYFGLALGLNNGRNWGGFAYEDVDALVNFQATSVTQYTETNASERVVQGVGILNGTTTVNYTVDVVESSANNWTFTLTLSNGYRISTPLNLGFLQIRQSCNN